MPKKKPKDEQSPEKHPRDMTSEEALDHLFHPEIAKKAREIANPPDDEDEDFGELE